MITRELAKGFRFLLALPKTLYFNFHYLPVRDALRLPFIVAHTVSLADTRGRVSVENPRPGMIRLGVVSNTVFEGSGPPLVWAVTGNIVFKGKADIGPGVRLYCSGEIEFGDDLVINAETTVMCEHRMIFGSNNYISWQCTFMDSDFHPIRDRAGERINPPRAIEFGNDIWVGHHVLVNKGSRVGNGSIVAAGAVVAKVFEGERLVVAGNPARVIKEDVYWSRN
jgi:acetyltransferase-like isoleucine patch superfamily enzyme